MGQAIAAVVFRCDRKSGSGATQRGHVEIGGQCHAAWWSGGTSAHETCWITSREIWIQSWRYHPQYDEAPEVWQEHFALSDYCNGAGRQLVSEAFGEPVAAHILAEVRQRNDAIAKQAPARPELRDTFRLRCAGTVRTLRARFSSALFGPAGERTRYDKANAWLSFATAVILVLWRVGVAAIDLGTDSALWWHARVAGDMLEISARVTGHDLLEYSGDGSWGHKSSFSSRKNWYYAVPVVEVEYAVTGAATQRSRRSIAETFDRSEKARAHLASRYPIGAEIAVLVSPGRTEHFLFAADDAPSFPGLALRLLKSLVIFLFIELPLIVLFSLLVVPGIGWLLAWPFRR